MTSGACTTLHALLCLDDGGFATVTIINLKPSRRMFNEVPSCGIRAELNATGIHAPTLPWGVQPRNQLSLDFPMVENCARTTATRSSCVALLLASVCDDYDNHRRGPTCVALCCVLQTVASRFSSTATWTPEPPHGTETCGTATRFRWWLIWRRRNPLSTSQAPANKPGPSRAPCAASRRRPRKRGWGLSRCVNINLTCSVDLHHLPFDPFNVRPPPSLEAPPLLAPDNIHYPRRMAGKHLLDHRLVPEHVGHQSVPGRAVAAHHPRRALRTPDPGTAASPAVAVWRRAAADHRTDRTVLAGPGR